MGSAPAPQRGRPPRAAGPIVETALRLVDEGGVQAFSLRTLAGTLGSGTATLYRHFASKDELMVDVVDRVLGEIRFSGPASSASWQQVLTSGAEAFYHALRRHPNTLPLLITQVPVGPNALAARERVLSLLVTHGFPTGLAARAFTAVGHCVIGFAIQQHGPGAADGTQLHAFYRTLDPATFPVTTAAASELTSVDPDEEFRFGSVSAVRYDPSFYEGAAAHFRGGRPPYSPGLEALLAAELGLNGSGRLLDVGCGPGILTVRLAHLFEGAVGLDPDPAMLAEGRRAAQERGIANITWIQARAEELPAVAPGPYRLVTFGQSFYWTDEVQVAEAVYDMVEPGGALAIVGHKAEGRAVPPSPGPPRIPHDEIRALVRKYLGSTKRAGQGTAPVQALSIAEALASTRFGAPRVLFAPGIPDRVQDTEAVLSNYFSMSFAAPHLFGDRVEEFAGEVRELLRERSPEGVFWDWPGDTEIMLARKAV